LQVIYTAFTLHSSCYMTGGSERA